MRAAAIPLSSSTRENLLSHLYQALDSPLGIIVVVSDVAEARFGYLQVRRESGDSALRALSFLPSPYSPHTELWIVKKQVAERPIEPTHPLEEELDTSLPIDIVDP